MTLLDGSPSSGARVVIDRTSSSLLPTLIGLSVPVYAVLNGLGQRSIAGHLFQLITLMTFGLVGIRVVSGRASARLLLLLGLVTFTTVYLDVFGEPQNWTALIRYLVSFAGLYLITLHRDVTFPTNPIALAGGFASCFGVAYAATAGGYDYAGTVRIAPFWDNLANSSTLMVGVFILTWVSTIRPTLRLLFLATSGGLVVGYGTVTPILMLLFFVAGRFLVSRGISLKWFSILLVLGTVGGLLFRNANASSDATVQSLGTGAIGSGRVDSWTERLGIFFSSDIVAKLVGTGPYSDYRSTNLWWWASKNAHSDLLTILMEFGAVGLLALVVLTWTLYRESTADVRAVLLVFIFGFASSNLLLDRPGVSVVSGVAICAWAFRSRHSVHPSNGDLLAERPQSL